MCGRAIKVMLFLIMLALAACRPGLTSTPTPAPTQVSAPLGIYFSIRDQMTYDSPPPPPYHLFALNASDGKVRWSRPGSNPTALDPAEIRPILDHGVIYIGDQGISAINASTGAMLWHYQADGTNQAHAIINRVVYATEVDTFNGELYALDANTGKLLWRSATLTNLRLLSISVTDNLIYAADPDTPGNLTAYSTANGAQLWRYQADGNNLVYFEQADSDHVYATVTDNALQGFLAVLDTRNGSQQWRFPRTAPGNITMEGAGQGLVYVASWDDSSLYALNTSDGTVKWQAPLGLVGSVSLTSDTLYVSSASATIYALDPEDGTVKWQVQMSGHIRDFDTRVQEAQQGLLYVSQTQDGIYALNTSDGSVKWHSASGGLAQGIDFSVLGASNGAVYLDVFNNNVPNPDTLYALNTADGSLLWSYHVIGEADFSFILG